MLIPFTLFFVGYYCPPGQNISNALHCEEGYKCPMGSPTMVPCESGAYQNEIAKGECKECVAGQYYDVLTLLNTKNDTETNSYEFCNNLSVSVSVSVS